MSLVRPMYVFCLMLGVASRPAAADSSMLSAPVHVPIGVLNSALENAVPSGAAETRPARIGGAVHDDTLSWNFVRGPIALSGGDGWLDASTSARGSARLSGRATIVRGDLGRLLGKLNPTTIPFSASADIAADLRLRARPRLAENWRLDADIEASAQIREASIPILNITRISVRGELQREVDGKLRDLADELRRRLADDPFLENAARKAWTDLCKAHPVATGATADIWLVVEPIAFHASQPMIDAAGMTVALGLEAETRLLSYEQAPECRPLPPLRIDRAQPGLSLTVLATLDYAALSSALMAQIDDERIDVADGALTLTPRDLRLSSDGAALSVEVDVDVRPSGFWSWLFGSTRAWVRLTTTPRLDAAQQRLTFTDSGVEAKSDDFGDAAGNLAELAQSMLVRRFEEAAVVDLAPYATRARDDAEKAAQSLDTADLGGLAVETARIDPPRLESVTPGPDALELVMVATGELRLALRDIPIGR